MLEGRYLSDLRKVLRSKLYNQNYVLFKHSSYTQIGIPDVSLTYNGLTTWWEAKVGTKIVGTELQLYNMKMLAVAGYARYILYNEEINSTFVVHPANVKVDGSFNRPEAYWSNLRAEDIAAYIVAVHRD